MLLDEDVLDDEVLDWLESELDVLDDELVLELEDDD